MIRLTSKRFGSLLLAFLTFAFPQPSDAQQGWCAAADTQVTVSKGFYRGVELNALDDHDLAMYAAGFVDALQAATTIGVTERCRRALQACVAGRSNTELAAMVRKYLREIRTAGRKRVMLFSTMRYSAGVFGNNSNLLPPLRT
jgi:hypothetical protein